MYDHDDSIIEKTVIADIKSTAKPDESRGSQPTVDALVLIYPTGPDLGKKWDISGQTVVIGRGSDCHIVVAKESVSRKHAQLLLDGTRRILEDLHSTNGTIVNDVIISNSYSLKNGDQIKIGDAIFKYLAGDENETAYHDEIYKMKITDGLTGINNRRHLLDEITRELHRAKRYKRLLSLIMIDIDHFKSINDTFGHLAGDYVLKAMCQLIKSESRAEDIFARFGGEEFAILIPETPLNEVLHFAERLRALIEKSAFSYEGNDIAVTISLGVASIDGDDISENDFIAIADEKMYRAKKNGRNRVQG